MGPVIANLTLDTEDDSTGTSLELLLILMHYIVAVLIIGQTGYGYAARFQLGHGYFEGTPYQRSHGLGSVFPSLWRYLLLQGKQAAASIGRKGLEATSRVLSSVLDANNTADLKETVRREATASAANLLTKASDRLRQGGHGRRRIVVLISSMFSSCKVNAFEIRNMVFTTQTPFRLRINALYEYMRAQRCFHRYEYMRAQRCFRRCFYDPICFPGIRCSVHAGKSPSLLIFASGRIICSGLKRPMDVLDIGNIFMPFIDAYKSRNL